MPRERARGKFRWANGAGWFMVARPVHPPALLTEPAPRPPLVAAGRGGRWPVRLAMLAAFALTLFLGTRHNDFPAEYGPDEPAKIAQIVSGQRDFHHPPLMLTLTRAALDLRSAGAQPAPGQVARTGRWISALALALAAAALTWLAGEYGGPAGACAAAAALGTDAQAVLAAHFFKEDALFALGYALTLAAGARHWQRRRPATLLALGASAGLAVAAKYVGALAVLHALVLAAWAAVPAGNAAETSTRSRWTRRARAAGVCALVAAAVFLLLNGVPLAGHLAEWWRGVRLGVDVSRHGNQAVGARVPHLAFWGMFLLFTPLPVMAGAIAFLARFFRRRPIHAHADRWLLALAPWWLLAVFSFSASTAVRYFLPVSLALDAAAGAAWPGLARGLLQTWATRRAHPVPPRWVNAATWAAPCFLLLLWGLPGAWRMAEGFGHDDRAALRTWIAQHLPPGATVAEDARAQLEQSPGANPPSLLQTVLTQTAVADLGDVAALRARGVVAVVVCWYDSRRYVDPSKRPSKGAAADYARRRAFYLSLPKEARLAWKSELRQPYVTRPGLELYLLDPR